MSILNISLVLGRQAQIYAHPINTQSSEQPFLFKIKHIEYKILKFPFCLYGLLKSLYLLLNDILTLAVYWNYRRSLTKYSKILI